MFIEGADPINCFVGPLLAILFGYLAYKFGPRISVDIEENTGQNHPWLRLLFNFSFLIVPPLGCYYSALIFDQWDNVIWQTIAKSLSVFIGITVVISIRTSIFPSWFGWLSAFIMIGLLTPIAWLFLPYTFVWLVVVSFWLHHSRG